MNQNNIRKPCVICSFPFKVRNSKQKYCLSCAEQVNRENTSMKNKINNRTLSDDGVKYLSR